jgi:predicted nucleic acid-binding protein
MAPDINVLLGASRSDHPHHVPALKWLNRAVAGAFTIGACNVTADELRVALDASARLGLPRYEWVYATGLTE